MKEEEMAERVVKIESKLDEHCKAQEISEKKNDEAHLRIEAKIDDLPAKLNNQFAPKWVEWFVKGIITAVIVAGIGIIVYLVESHMK